ncbi:MAG: uroporphyrinogen-III synthase [Rhodanobacter sp.]|nr:MAG: uroporphyrinogen-III synthase [Rhodanobacter sp.]TAM41885.1 MAG: uroporphyrinogen-III synthase [Rhodanobacter sp.]TAN29174.1 MAG: uroporphyrinogen-III synthase [Rhodanobacter sp.]
MQLNSSMRKDVLHGRVLIITRPVGTARALARRVRALGGTPVLLPGLALRGPHDVAAARAALRDALADPLVIFTSPAAVRHAAALAPLHTRAIVLAVGRGTASALRRHGVQEPLVPGQQDSEGLLGLPLLQDLRNRRVALVGAPGGRGVLRGQLAARGACVRDVQVYRRVPPRLDRRHVAALLALPGSAQVLLSSNEALQNLRRLLPLPALERLLAATAVVSSERLAAAARGAGFTQIERACSALADDLLAAAAR